MMRPDLAAIDSALAHTLELTMRRLARQRRPASWYRRLIAGKLRRRPWLPRDQRHPLDVWRRDERDARRQRIADAPVPLEWSDTAQAYYDGLYHRAESRATSEVRYAGIRELVAAKLELVAEWARDAGGLLGPREFCDMAEKLRQARRVGYWGLHLDTAEVIMRFRDRSGLALLDPSEARERQAELVRRLVPELVRIQKAGLRLYYAVASEPNVPAGSLAFGKRHLFERFRRVILGRSADGRPAPDGGAFPEIVGAFAVQEDPLAGDLCSWNVHLNLILVVDPAQCDRLPDDLARVLELVPGGAPAPARALARTPAGCLSYSKVHYAWGSDQFFIRPLEAATAQLLGRKLLEVVKYSAKWVSSKQMAGLDAGPLPGDAHMNNAGPSRPAFELTGGQHRRPGGQPALGVTEWPEARVAEWIEAARGFRRVRGWGALYRIAREELPPDPDAAGRIRWLGRVYISARGVVIEAARLSYVTSTHGDKSGRDFHGSTGRSPGQGARAGPAGAQAVA